LSNNKKFPDKIEEIPDNDYHWRVLGGIFIILIITVGIVCVTIFSYALTAPTIVLLFGMLFISVLSMILLVLRRQTKEKSKFTMNNPWIGFAVALISGIILILIGQHYVAIFIK
jgi:hypothetical protein